MWNSMSNFSPALVYTGGFCIAVPGATRHAACQTWSHQHQVYTADCNKWFNEKGKCSWINSYVMVSRRSLLDITVIQYVFRYVHVKVTHSLPIWMLPTVLVSLSQSWLTSSLCFFSMSPTKKLYHIAALGESTLLDLISLHRVNTDRTEGGAVRGQNKYLRRMTNNIWRTNKKGNLVGRTPRTLSRSTVCSAPRACRGCRCQHTWEPSVERGFKSTIRACHWPRVPEVLLWQEEATDLQDKEAVAGVAQAQVLLFQVHAESRQVIILSADVRSQD